MTTDTRYFGYTTLTRAKALRRQYSVTSRAWYADAILSRTRNKVMDEVTVGHYSTGGGTTGEFTIELIDLEHGKPLAIQVCIFDDAWHLFQYEADLFGRLATLKEPTLADVEAALQAEGFQDRTPIRDPDNHEPALRRCERCQRQIIPLSADREQVYCGRRDCASHAPTGDTP